MRRKRFTYAQVEFMCEQLAMMLGSGMSITNGLELLRSDMDDKLMTEVCHEIASDTEKGIPLSESAKKTGCFPEYAYNMMYIGEVSGKLEEALRGLAEYYDERDDIRRVFRNAVFRPMALLLMMTVVIIVLVLAVIPMFGDIFSQFDSSVNSAVQQTIDLAYNSGIVIMIVLLALIVIIGVIAILSVKKKTAGKLRSFASVFPLTRGLSEKLTLADITRAISISVSAGISPTEMMMHANIRSFINDKRVGAKFDECEKCVIDGESFSQAIEKSELLPPLYANSLKLAYDSGCFEGVWKKISENYSDEAARSLINVSSIIEPAIIVVLGILIGAVLLMLMIPLMNIMSVLG